MMTADRLDALLGWLTFGEYLLTAVLAVLISWLVKKNLTYWPAVRTLSVTQGMKAVYWGIAACPLTPDDWANSLRVPFSEALVQTLIIGGLAWTLALVCLQNRVDNKAIVDVDGRVHPISAETARVEASKTLQWAGEIEAAHGHTPPLWWRRKA